MEPSNLSAVDNILKLLQDGNWHNLEEIRDKTRLEDPKVSTITSFLAQYKIIRLDKKRQKAKLNGATLDFLNRIQEMEKTPAYQPASV